MTHKRFCVQKLPAHTLNALHEQILAANPTHGSGQHADYSAAS